MNNTNQLKDFINNFNYPDPSWDNLPEGFPNCSKSGLSPQEQGLLEGIVLAWYNEDGRTVIYKRSATISTVLTTIIFIIFLSVHTLSSPTVKIVRSVSAATVSAMLKKHTVSEQINDSNDVFNNVFESTVSGLLRSEYE